LLPDKLYNTALRTTPSLLIVDELFVSSSSDGSAVLLASSCIFKKELFAVSVVQQQKRFGEVDGIGECQSAVSMVANCVNFSKNNTRM